MAFNNVDLPAPTAPTIMVIDSLSICKLISCKIEGVVDEAGIFAFLNVQAAFSVLLG
jgi:hypothetical protein